MTDTLSTTSPARRHGGGPHARRVIFIDLARALAVVFMLYGHTVDALLAPGFRSGRIYDVWQFQRGLTSSLFFLLSGFAFSVATARHWSSHLTWSPQVRSRLRRFAIFIVLGYAIRVPTAPIWRMATARDEWWRTLEGVDVLQLIGVTFIGVQALVMLSRRRRTFAFLALTSALVLTFSAPWIWSAQWPTRLPPAIAAYLTPEIGSLFPVVPWSAFILGGAALGQLYAHWGAAHLRRYATFALLLPGVALTLFALWLTHYQNDFFGDGPYAYVPGNILLRVAVALIIVGAIAHASRHIGQLPYLFSAVAQESLVIYVLHLAIVYGSVWAPGLYNFYGETRTPLQLLPIVVLVISTMALVAYSWHWLKHAHRGAARWVTIAIGVAICARLLL